MFLWIFVLALACSRGAVVIPTLAPTPSPVPTSTPMPADGGQGGGAHPATPPAPTPTGAPTQPPVYAGETTLYYVQSGDTLPVIAGRFAATVEEIAGLNGLSLAEEITPGQLLIVPARLSADAGPGLKLVPDSEVVYSLGAIGFDAAEFVRAQGGYLARHREFVEAKTRRGGDIVQLVADHFSVNPRLLLALIEYQTGWVTQPEAGTTSLEYPLGLRDPRRAGLANQLYWAADMLNFGYYHWRDGSLSALDFGDGTLLRIAPDQNAGTVALQYFFSRLYAGDAWRAAVAADGFSAAYRRLFGDPFQYAIDPLLPPDLTQPELRLPFFRGVTWIYSGGPHGAWESGSAWAALDFAPPSTEAGCAQSDEWVVASAPGLVVRADDGTLALDLDGDGYEQSGWALFYMHVAERDRAAVGTWVEAGERLGHPSCEGGRASGTHVHFARKFNGEWIPADGPIPFVLSGWTAHSFGREYRGSLTRGTEELVACDCVAESNKISLER